jgi:hypothetical protein
VVAVVAVAATVVVVDLEAAAGLTLVAPRLVGPELLDKETLAVMDRQVLLIHRAAAAVQARLVLPLLAVSPAMAVLE